MMRWILGALLCPLVAIAGPGWKREAARLDDTKQPRMEVACPEGLYVSAIRPDGTIECSPVMSTPNLAPPPRRELLAEWDEVKPGETKTRRLSCPKGYIVDHWGFSLSNPHKVQLQSIEVKPVRKPLLIHNPGTDGLPGSISAGSAHAKTGSLAPTQVVFKATRKASSLGKAGFSSTAWCIESPFLDPLAHTCDNCF